jgi:hypothetical protein
MTWIRFLRSLARKGLGLPRDDAFTTKVILPYDALLGV